MCGEGNISLPHSLMVLRLTWVDVIQHPIRQQRTQLNQLLNPLRHMTPRSIQINRKHTHHGISRSQGLAEVGEQAFVIEAFHDGV